MFLISKLFISHTWVYRSILSIGSLFCEKISLWSLRSPRVVTFFAYCYPSCVEVIVEVVFGFVGIPLSVEVIVVEFGFCAYPSSKRWLFWLCAYPSIERLILCGLVLCLLCRGCCFLREELCTPSLYYSNPQWRFPVWEGLCGRIVKILLCEGGDVEQWLEPRNISWCLRLIHYL